MSGVPDEAEGLAVRLAPVAANLAVTTQYSYAEALDALMIASGYVPVGLVPSEADIRADERAKIAARLEPWMRLCGSCDAGLPMGCTCPAGDIRAALAAVLAAGSSSPAGSQT